MDKALADQTSDTLAIKRAPCPFAFGAGDGEVTAADHARLGTGSASAFHFLRVTRIEAQLALGAIALDELNADDVGASFGDDALDNFRLEFVANFKDPSGMRESGHGERGTKEGLAPR